MLNISTRVMEHLKQSGFWCSTTRTNGKSIQGLICPECGDRSAWAYAPGAGNGPMAICCNRKNSCGAVTKTIELLNIQFNIEKEQPATKKDPHRPARAYLESRGLSKILTGLQFEYWPKIRKASCGAIMFPVQSPQQKQVHNGRLLNPAETDAKTHNQGSTTGAFWMHPAKEYDPKESTFVTEGIIDSLSIIELGEQSIAILAAGQDPGKVKLPPLGKLIFAFDNDPAGTAATERWLAAYPKASAIMPSEGDWNDLLKSSDIDSVKKIFRANQERYKFNADLQLAASPRKYARLHHDFLKKPPGIFTYHGSTYYSYTKKKNDEKQIVTERICKCSLDCISYLRDNTDPDKPEFSLLLKIKPPKKKAIETIATSRDLSTPRGLKEFFLARAGITFEGGAPAATALSTFLTSAQVPEVTQLALTGYEPASRWYISKYFAIDTRGKKHTPDKQGLYKISHNTWYRSAAHSNDKALQPSGAGPSIVVIHKLITDGWGENGAACFAWMIASWFVSGVKKELNWFPFLSLYGPPSSGKSAITTSLYAMQGYDTDGLPITSLNSKKGLARSISRVSNLFTALLEDNRRDQSSFDYSIILTGYNSGPLQIQAAYSGDNRTAESPFYGTLMFVQNTEPFITQAEKERVISLQFDTALLSPSTRAAFEKLTNLPKGQLTRVIQLVLRHRTTFENEFIKEYEQAILRLEGVDNRRILQNHALILAFHNIICRLFKIEYDLTDFMLRTAQKKVFTSAQRTYDQADRFFEALTHLDNEKATSCAHIDTDKNLLYINLPGVEEQLKYAGINLYANNELIQALIMHQAFLEHGKVFRFPNDQQTGTDGRTKTRKVWLFDTSKL